MGPVSAMVAPWSSGGQGQECPPLVGACLELGRGLSQHHDLFDCALLHWRSFALHFHTLHPALTLRRPHIYMYNSYWWPPSGRGGGGGGQQPAPTCRPPRPEQVLEQPQLALAQFCVGRCLQGLQPGSIASSRHPHKYMYNTILAPFRPPPPPSRRFTTQGCYNLVFYHAGAANTVSISVFCDLFCVGSGCSRGPRFKD